MNFLALLATVFCCAFIAGVGWTLSSGIAIVVCKHLEMRLMARRLQKNSLEELERIKAAGNGLPRCSTPEPTRYMVDARGGQA